MIEKINEDQEQIDIKPPLRLNPLDASITIDWDYIREATEHNKELTEFLKMACVYVWDGGSDSEIEFTDKLLSKLGLGSFS